MQEREKDGCYRENIVVYLKFLFCPGEDDEEISEKLPNGHLFLSPRLLVGDKRFPFSIEFHHFHDEIEGAIQAIGYI